MRKPVRWTTFALQVLEEIYAYILIESGSEPIARRYVSRIIDRSEQLIDFSVSGQAEPILHSRGYKGRYLVIGNYKIIYEVTEDEVHVLDVFHTKMNPKKIVSRTRKRK